jgi:3'-phosphoadenosine 5'-phosphosulfate sulfotransferase (PAPS reductase)/FAD synthetase
MLQLIFKKFHLSVCVCVYWIYLTQNGNQWRPLVNTKAPCGYMRGGDFLTSRANVSYSRIMQVFEKLKIEETFFYETTEPKSHK